MKSTLICIFSILLINSLIGQTSEPASNTPGENQVENTADGIPKNEADVSHLRNEIKWKANRVESKYFEEKEVLNSYDHSYSTTTVKVKSRIYKASEILLEHLNGQVDELPASNYSEMYIALKKIEKVYDRMLFLVGQENTRQLEKKLKKLKDPSEIASVFFDED